MASRPPDSQSSQPFQGTGFLAGLVAIARLGLVAILFYGALNGLVNLFHGASLSRTTGASPGVTNLTLVMAAAAAIVMVAVTLNAAFLVGRLFSRRVAAFLFAAALALAVGSVVVGRLGSTKLGAVTFVIVLIPTAAFLLSMLLARLAGPAPSARSGRPSPTDPRPPASGPSQPSARPRQRRRRNGRKR